MLPEAEFGTPNQLHVHFTPDFRGEKHALRPELHVFRVKRPEETPCPGCACAHSRWRCRGPLTCSRSTARGGGARTRTRSPAGRPRCARRLPCARRGSGDRRPHTSFQSTLGGGAGRRHPRPRAGRWWLAGQARLPEPDPLRKTAGRACSPRRDVPGHWAWSRAARVFSGPDWDRQRPRDSGNGAEGPGRPRAHGRASQLSTTTAPPGSEQTLKVQVLTSGLSPVFPSSRPEP